MPQAGMCTDSSPCYPVQVTTVGFPGDVTCDVTASNPLRNDMVSWTMGGNASTNIPAAMGGVAW